MNKHELSAEYLSRTEPRATRWIVSKCPIRESTWFVTMSGVRVGTGFYVSGKTRAEAITLAAIEF